jgi:hypothetical protein
MDQGVTQEYLMSISLVLIMQQTENTALNRYDLYPFNLLS